MHKSKRQFFSNEENKMIKESVKLLGEDWEAIAKKLPGRTPKQIHDRYVNYLREGLKSEPWINQEDNILIELYKSFGPKWTKMMKYLPGRSGNDIKNRWHKHLMKKVESENKKADSELTHSDDSDCKNSLMPKMDEQNFVQNTELENNVLHTSTINNPVTVFPEINYPSNTQNHISPNPVKIVKKVDLMDKSIIEKDYDDINNCLDIINSIFKDDYEIQFILEEFNQQIFYF